MIRAAPRTILSLCLVVTIGGQGRAVAQSLRAVPLDHWSYAVVDELLLRRPDLGGRGTWGSAGPWREEDFREILARAQEAGLAAGDSPRSRDVDHLSVAFPAEDAAREVRFHNEPSLEIVVHASEDDLAVDPPFLGTRFAEDDGDPPVPSLRAIARHDFAVQYRDRFALGWRYAVDSDVTNDPTRFRQIEAREDTDYGFALLDAYVTARYGPLSVTAGRNELALGPAGRTSGVFLADSIPPLDQIRIELDTRAVRFTGVIARLSGDLQNRSVDESGETIPGSDPPERDRRPVDRILYLHRLDWEPHPSLQVAVSESAIVTGFDRGLDARYANLLIPFFVSQEDEDESGGVDVDVNVNAEGVLRIPWGARLWANLYAQELFIDEDKREEIGNQLAWKLGALAAGDRIGLPAWTLGLEYTRVDVFTYLHRGLNTDATHFGVPLGSTLGPDADLTEAWLVWRPQPALRLTTDLAYRRDGERGVGTSESVIDAGNPSFPSGVVEREWRWGVEGRGVWPRHGVEGRLRVVHHDLEAIGHEPGREGDFWSAELALRVSRDFVHR